MKKVIFSLFFVLPFAAIAQDFSFLPDTTTKVIVDNRLLSNAWAGGLNAPQFSTCKLNNDGFEDLVIFDRTNNKLSTFLAVQDSNGKFSWKYAPEYESQFPDIQFWILLVDYDQDGKKDIFTYAPAGIQVFRNVSDGGKLLWQQVENPLHTIGHSGPDPINLYVAASDVPAIVDVDNDGDVDILAFDTSGNFIEFHQNFSQEQYKDNKHFAFKKIGNCWGNFVKEHCKDFVFDVDCQSTVAGITPPATNPSPDKVLHSGNSILIFDMNGDNKKDMLFGHVSCTNIAQLHNEGSEKQAIFKTAQYVYPLSNPIDFNIFPAVYNEDFDFDGIKDIIAAPNGYDNAQYTVDYQKSVRFYKNFGTNDNVQLVFQTSDFLQNTMIDVGENASPVFADIDGDGDQDLLVGIGGIRTDDLGVRGSIYLFENTGTATSPAFQLKTRDYLNLSQSLQLFDIKPFVTDMNGDGIPDFGFAGTSFKGMELRYIVNKGEKNKAFSLNLAEAVVINGVSDIQPGDSPLFVDVDRDGKKDLLLGKARGTIQYYKNKGTSQSPVYNKEIEEFGGLKFDYVTGNVSLAALDLNGDGKPELIAANREGHMKVYKSFQDQDFTLFKADTNLISNSLTQKAEYMKLGGMLSVSGADLNGDLLPEIVLGTNSGGLRFLKNTSKLIVTGVEEEIDPISVFPNPANKNLTVKVPFKAEIELVNLQGKSMISKKPVAANQENLLDLSMLTEGVYLLKIDNGTQIRSKKIIVKK